MAKNYLEGLLGENEQIILETHQHWFVLFGKIFLELLLIVIIIVAVLSTYTIYPFVFYGIFFVVVRMLGILYDILVWRITAYIVTNRRVIQISGVFNMYVVDSSLDLVDDAI